MSTSVTILIDDSERRRALRRPVQAGATLRNDGMSPIDAVLHDISSSGFLIALAEPIAIGERVRLGVAGNVLGWATVVRREGDLHGCHFHQPVPPNVVHALRAGELGVARLGALDAAGAEPAVEERLPVPMRFAIIGGGSLLLWVAIAGIGRACGFW